jgi:large subunit ribosomal protein L24e
MAKCTFCGEMISPGTGKIYVLKEGKTYDFCSLKCEKNMIKLKRKPLKTKWSSKFIKTK